MKARTVVPGLHAWERAREKERDTEAMSPPDQAGMQEARTQITNVIVEASVDMTKRVVRSVKERGSVSGLSFLWKMAGMFPVPTASEPREPGSLAKLLIEQLELYEDLPEIEGDGNRDVESEGSKNGELELDGE